MSVEEVVLYKNEKGIVTLTLNRPEALNALNRDVLNQLSTILDRIKTDPSVKAVILTGAGEKLFRPAPTSRICIRRHRWK